MTQESVGERLRRLREARGLKQRDLAEPGISGPYISRIEQGSRRPSLRALRRLAAKLGVTPEYLETGAHAGWQAFRPLFVGKDQPPHKDWVRHVFIRRLEREIARNKRAMKRLELENHLETLDALSQAFD